MTEEQILLVEGEDDEHVVKHLYREVHGAEPPFEILNKMGFSKLLKGLPQDLKRSGLKTLGVLADANDDLEARWQELVEAAAQRARLPDAPGSSGTLVEGSPRLGVWLMPDNGSSGELEDFACELVPASDPVWPLAEQYIAAIAEADRKFRPGKISKANLYAWLASRKHPQRIGAAIGTGDLDANADLAKKFAQWLSDLFGE